MPHIFVPGNGVEDGYEEYFSINEIIDSCDSLERKELFRKLMRPRGGLSISETIFEDEIMKLHGNCHKISNEDEQTILNICKKL